jgi:hypothetical protein
MLLDDCYRLLELDPSSSDEEIKRAHRDLTKVWHPDRFGNDAALRHKAEEKLKAINVAHEMILASRGSADAPRRISPNRGYALTCALIAIFILLRRPTLAGLVIAAVLFVVAFVLFARSRR